MIYLIETDALGERAVLRVQATSPRQAQWCVNRLVRERNNAYGMARLEHAFLLRCEGVKYRDIGDRLGVTIERARQMTHKFARRLKYAMIGTWAQVQ